MFESASLTPVVGASHEANKIINNKANFFIISIYRGFAVFSSVNTPIPNNNSIFLLLQDEDQDPLLGNFSQLKEAIKNSDIVINLIGILYETRKQKFYNIHSDIPEAVSKICSESDVKKFIHVSAIGANENSKSLYQKSKYQGEVKALKNFKNTVILRPSVVCGTEDNFTNLFSKLSILPIIPIVGINYKFQPILVNDVADAIVHAIELKGNEGKIYEIGGPKTISFGDMVKLILKTINKKRFVVPMPMPIAKIQSTVLSLLPIPPILTKDQCEILSEADNVVSNNHMTLQDLNVKPSDVEEAMKKWLWRYKDGGEFAKV